MLASAFAIWLSDAQAMEQYEPQLPGATEGTAAGLMPPPGLYGSVQVYTMAYTLHNNAGQTTRDYANNKVISPTLLWNSGKKIFGADYGVQIIQPFQHTNISGSNSGTTIPSNAQWGTFNTVLVPAILGWHLSNDFHIKTAVAVNLNNASSSLAKPPAVPSAGAGNGFSSIIPNFGVSWLGSNWNLSANLFYSFNQPNSATQYISGQLFQADYTIAKTLDRWTVGLGAFQANQITSDSGSGSTQTPYNCVANNGCKERRFGLGPMLSYSFDGGVTAQLIYNRDIVTVNAMGGPFFNFSLSTPLNF